MVQKGGIGMVEQFMYFWLLWLLVIVVFFFINNDSLQRGSLVTILLIIACTDIAMALDYFIIHMNVLFVIIYGLFFYARTRRPFFTALYTFICALRSEEHTSELQSRGHLVCRLLLAKKK